MAHFAKLDENNNVLEVIVVSNDALDSNDEEASGIAFLTEWSGGYSNWKQTSYNGTMRSNFASVGGVYYESLDAFIYAKPFKSWVLDELTHQWKPPVEYPKDGNNYQWSGIEDKWIQTNE
jgi:hypothetical protein